MLRKASILLALLAIGAAAPSAARADPNDSPSGASGPLLNAESWTGAIGTENDVDWFVLYAQAGSEMEAGLVGLGPESCFGPEMELYASDGSLLSDTSGYAETYETKFIRRTIGPGTYFLKVFPYHLDVLYCNEFGPAYGYGLVAVANPPLLSSPPYAPPPPQVPPAGTRTPHGVRGEHSHDHGCRKAQSRVGYLRRRLRQAGSSSKPRVRASLRRARRDVRRLC
jgi:hypothetical protein